MIQNAPRSIVVIPAYQPTTTLVLTTRSLRQNGMDVVVIDDGSGPDYIRVFDQLPPDVHVVRHKANLGKGAALKSGFRYIADNFDKYIIITADADGQHQVSDIVSLAEAYNRHPQTLLLGSRKFDSANVPLRSMFGNVVTRNVFSLISRRRLTDTQTGLRAFDQSLTDVMLEVPGEHFEYEMNVLMNCSAERISIVELPIETIYLNGNQSSHFNAITDSWSIYREVFKFISSSLIAFGLDYVIFIVLLQATSGWNQISSVIVANVIARIISASFNFSVNSRLVFKSADNKAKQAVHYALLAGGILLLNTLVLNMLTELLDIAPYIAKIMTEATLFVVSYIVQKHLIFSSKKEVYT